MLHSQPILTRIEDLGAFPLIPALIERILTEAGEDLMQVRFSHSSLSFTYRIIVQDGS
jgi:hypothetical protein